MAVYFRGDPEPVRWIRERPDGTLAVLMLDDAVDASPLVTYRDRLVADGGANELDAFIAACETTDPQNAKESV